MEQTDIIKAAQVIVVICAWLSCCLAGPFLTVNTDAGRTSSLSGQQRSAAAATAANRRNYSTGLRITVTKERALEDVKPTFLALPLQYSSVAEGRVTPVKDQGDNCECCVAFATIAVMETCFSRVTGRQGDYSEQELIDCAYKQEGADGPYGANGCEPTDGLTAYLEYVVDNELLPASEEQYPYRYGQPKLSCPELPWAKFLAAKPLGYFNHSHGSEEKLKELVFQHGAVIAAVTTNQAFRDYRGGVFVDCEEEAEIDHAVTVVGFGKSSQAEGSLDYWLIKNSWGVDWGESGYMRLQRDVGMCGIGQWLAGITCTAATFEESGEEEYYDEEEEEAEGDMRPKLSNLVNASEENYEEDMPEEKEEEEEGEY